MEHVRTIVLIKHFLLEVKLQVYVLRAVWGINIHMGKMKRYSVQIVALKSDSSFLSILAYIKESAKPQLIYQIL